MITLPRTIGLDHLATSCIPIDFGIAYDDKALTLTLEYRSASLHGVIAPRIPTFAVEMRKQNSWIAAICVHDPGLTIAGFLKIAGGAEYDALSICRPRRLIA